LVLADGTTPTLAGTLDQFLRNKLSMPSAEQCRAYVEANFSWPKIAEQVSEIYCRVAHAQTEPAKAR